MIQNYYLDLAQRAAAVAADRGLPNVKPEWLYSQWAHESTNVTEGDPDCGCQFRSALAREYNNFGGITDADDQNDAPQPDGQFCYKRFSSPEEYADYFGRYISLYKEDGIDSAQTLDEYVRALKRGGYFGADIEVYLAGTYAVLRAEFPGIE